MNDRTTKISHWLQDKGYTVGGLQAASSDASFRRYLRGNIEGVSRIVMDAPPENEDCRPFVKIARELHRIGLNVPEVLETDLENGFLLLGDLGDRQYLNELNSDTVEKLYDDAINALVTMQVNGMTQDEIPPYDDALLMQEMALFREWFLGKHLALELNEDTHDLLDSTYAFLAGAALEQPGVFVHRDYHSRNLMVTEKNNPGILDFQDAVFGPVTYDLVSLLRDCYIAWPRQQVEKWALAYRSQAIEAGLFDRDIDEQQFLYWFDLMGVQRHLKAIGIFSRLNHRDGKPGYLNDIPRTLAYVEEVSGRYPALKGFHDFIVQRVKLGLEAAILDA